MSAQLDHVNTFPALINGQLGGPYTSDIKWLDVQGQPVYTHFLLKDTKQVQAEYYNTCDSGYAFQGYWDNGKVRNTGIFRLGDAISRIDTIPWFDVETYEETVKIMPVVARTLIKEGIWTESDTSGASTVLHYVDGKLQGRQLFFNDMDVLVWVSYYQTDTLVKDSSTNILYTQDTGAIRKILLGNWAMDHHQRKCSRIQEDYSRKRMNDYVAFFKFLPSGVFTQNIYVGCKFINGGLASGVQEIHSGTYQLVEPNNLELTINHQCRNLSLRFLSNDTLIFREASR